MNTRNALKWAYRGGRGYFALCGVTIVLAFIVDTVKKDKSTTLLDDVDDIHQEAVELILYPCDVAADSVIWATRWIERLRSSHQNFVSGMRRVA